MPVLVSIQVGKPAPLKVDTSEGQVARSPMTGFIKKPVDGNVWLGKFNLSGDGQADLKYHGGIEKAVLAYSAGHYPYWRVETNCAHLSFGAFGENFTVDGLTEESVCIGDTYHVGDARLQVSQPRQPCWKISHRWQIKDLSEKVKSTGRTGWYLRVLEEGYVRSGLSFELTGRPFPQWTIARANDIMCRRHEDRLLAAELALCPLLSENWRATLSGKRHGFFMMHNIKTFIDKVKKLAERKE